MTTPADRLSSLSLGDIQIQLARHILDRLPRLIRDQIPQLRLRLIPNRHRTFV